MSNVERRFLVEEYQVSVGEKELDREEIVGFLARIFGPNYYDAYTVQSGIYDTEPSTCPGNFVLARSPKGELIGIVRIVERSILVGDSALRAGFISSVGIRPDWRERGVLSRLMERAIHEMVSRKMDISLLYGRRAVDGLYSRYGYYGIGRYVDLEILSPIDTGNSISAVTLREENLGICRKLYMQSYGGLSGSILRDSGVWDYLLLRVNMKSGGVKLLMCQEKGRIIGYIVIFEEKLIEMSIPPRFYSAIPQLLRSLDVRVISIHPRHTFSIFCYTHMNTIQKTRFALDGGYMARILNPGSLLKSLGHVLASRAAIIGASNKVVKLLDIEVNLSDGQVSNTSKPNDISFENPDTVVQLLLGVIRPDDILGVKWSKEKPWISFLFPELHYHTSAWDEV